MNLFANFDTDAPNNSIAIFANVSNFSAGQFTLLLQNLSSSQLPLKSFPSCCIGCLFSLLHNWRDNWHIFIKMLSTTGCAVSDCNATNSPATRDAHRWKDTTSWNQKAGELHSQRRTTAQHNATFEDKSFVRLPTSTPPNN